MPLETLLMKSQNSLARDLLELDDEVLFITVYTY